MSTLVLIPSKNGETNFKVGLSQEVVLVTETVWQTGIENHGIITRYNSAKEIIVAPKTDYTNESRFNLDVEVTNEQGQVSVVNKYVKKGLELVDVTCLGYDKEAHKVYISEEGTIELKAITKPVETLLANNDGLLTTFVTYNNKAVFLVDANQKLANDYDIVITGVDFTGNSVTSTLVIRGIESIKGVDENEINYLTHGLTRDLGVIIDYNKPFTVTATPI